MHLEFKYTFNDYAEANATHSRFNRLRAILWIIIGPILVAGFILMALDGTMRSPSGSIVSYLPVLVFFALTSPWGMRLLYYVRWRHQPSLHSAISYEISEGSVVVTTDTSRSEMNWETFTRFRESKNLFMLYAGRYLFYMIPKRAFAGENDAAEFRELAQRRVAVKR
jgi:hypothetical protein